MVDRDDYPRIPGLHAFRLQLGQENKGAMRGSGHVLPMEWNLQPGPRFPHPTAPIANGVAVEHLSQAEGRTKRHVSAGSFVG